MLGFLIWVGGADLRVERAFVLPIQHLAHKNFIYDRSSESSSIQKFKIKDREERSRTRRRTRTKEWNIIRREKNGESTTRRNSNCTIKLVQFQFSILMLNKVSLWTKKTNTYLRNETCFRKNFVNGRIIDTKAPIYVAFTLNRNRTGKLLNRGVFRNE